MAKIIPPTIHAGTTSKGEAEIFLRLRDDPSTHDWIVLHSLDVANHQKQVSGEIDFVVIIPGKGVLCIEVKACHHLRRDKGQWYYGTSTHPDARGPFKQAAQAMHSMRTKLLSQHPSLSNVLFWSSVIFPYVEFNEHSEEWHPWQIIDTMNFMNRPIGVLLERILDTAHMFIRTKSTARWFSPASGEPTIEQCTLIAETLRPDFEFFESPKSRKRRQNEELKNYTSEQFDALDAMEANSRVIFRGLAGTGKTFLALEGARRSSEIGRKVLFLCYNHLLGKWLENQVGDLNINITCKTIHSYMMFVTGQPEISPSSDFWQQQLPTMAIDKLLVVEGDDYQFDEIILDEAQDILRENYLDFLDLCLRGGLTAGHWKFFGDFEKQAIYNAANMSIEQFQQDRVIHAPIYSLRVNCRNTPRVAELVHLLGNLKPGYSRILRPDNKIEPALKYYNNNKHQQKLLLTTLEQLYIERFIPNDIIILSSKTVNTCIANTVTISPWKERLKPIDTAIRGYVGYTSISAFKGLEAEVVIVTDIDIIDSEIATSLFYIAATRALQRLVILLHEPVKREIARLLNIPM